MPGAPAVRSAPEYGSVPVVKALVTGVLLTAGFAHAESVIVVVNEAAGLSDAAIKRIQKSAENQLQALSPLKVVDGGGKKGAPRKCGEDCVTESLQNSGADAALVIDAKTLDKTGEKFGLDCAFWLGSQRGNPKHVDATVDSMDAALKPTIDSVMPGWARRGFGGLSLSLERGSVVKIDGRLTPAASGEVLSLPAGPHLVDLIFPSGHAVMQRLEVTEGQRTRASIAPLAEGVTAAPKTGGVSALRATSYAAFMVGAATIAGGLIAGSLGRRSGADVIPCTSETRSCATLDEALRLNQQAKDYAATGNILLGVGGSLAALGVGLFITDAVISE